MTDRMTADEYQAMLKADAAKPKSKYNNKRTKYDSPHVGPRTYDSIAEVTYARDLDFRQRTGEIQTWIPQVSVPLRDGVRYVVDFLVIHNDGTVEFVDVKGVETPVFKLKKKQFEGLYGVPLKIMR